MHALAFPKHKICARLLRATVSSANNTRLGSSTRLYSNAAPQQQQEEAQPHISEGTRNSNAGQEEGTLTRRLREMSEDALLSGGRGAVKAVEEAGFSAELKAQLEHRIAAATLASSEASLPASASRQTRDIATAQPWTGTESLHDVSLRMLNDAHKPMRLGRAPRMPGIQLPQTIDTGHKRSKEGRGARLANARDRSTIYATSKDQRDAQAADREKRHQELKDRFEPHARVIAPGSIQAIGSLANQRIEDAIARGQFKNIPRGRGENVERDHNASSPFIDTTEYFMNKIIQKQEIVPPWIEKQQELTAAARKFRTRLRADWKRHAARMISSKGGSLQDQVRRAEAYAQAELLSNPMVKKPEAPVEVKIQKENLPSADVVTLQEIIVETSTTSPSPEVILKTPTAVSDGQSSSQSIEAPVAPSPPLPMAFPFRDPDWERVEHAYFVVAIKDLNDKARSYNLQAPELAKRPYFKLDRELNACYADVAPLLAEAILDRARRPAVKVDTWQGSGEKSVLGSIMGGPVRIRDERREKQYGIRQFWRDLWVPKPPSLY